MTQTNQNKDYSWQWLDDLYQPNINDLELDERHGKDRPVVYLDQAKAAIQSHIDEHYIGKGEATTRITDAELEEVVNQIAKFLDKGLPGNAAVRLRQFANKVKARSEAGIETRYTADGRGWVHADDFDKIMAAKESEVEQRCIEAQSQAFYQVEEAFCQIPPLDEIARYGDHLRGRFDQCIELKDWLTDRRKQLSTNNKDTKS